MTQKERLVEDVKLQIFATLGNVDCDTCVYKGYDREPCSLCHINYNQWAISKDTLQNLAESIVKRAVKNGVIVPPCKVGDVVYKVGIFDDYYISKGKNYIAEGKIQSISYDEGEHFSIRALSTFKVRPYMNFVFADWEFGKTVFLTREEAEQALKECETK